MQRRLLLISQVALVTAFNPTALATSIVYVQYPGGYAVGADSLRFYPANNQDVAHIKSVCKLRVMSDVVLATYDSAGSDDAHHDNGRLIPGLRELSDEILLSPRWGNSFLKTKRLAETIERDKEYRTVLSKHGHDDAGWVFIDKNGAYGGAITQDGARTKLDPNNNQSDALAVWTLARPFVKTSVANGLPTREAALSIVRKALQLAQRQEPQLVGPPYSLLTIDGAGAKWVDKGVCSASIFDTGKH